MDQIKGTYRYKWRDKFSKAVTRCTLRVEVVALSRTQYHVKYLGLHADGSPFGSLHWVGKDKVKLDAPLPDIDSAARIVREGVTAPRLPYKDD